MIKAARLQGPINRRIIKSRKLAEAGRYHRALGVNGRVVAIMTGIASLLPDGDLANRSALGDLYYERSGYLQQLGRGEEAIEAITHAVLVYESVDPTHGDPAAVPDAIAAYRRAHGTNGLEEFEMRVGRPANARSYLALLLAVHERLSARDRVEALCDGAVKTLSGLVAHGIAYDRTDLEMVRSQAAIARAQLLG